MSQFSKANANKRHEQNARPPPLRKGEPGGPQQEVRTLVKELRYTFSLLDTGLIRVRTLRLKATSLK